MERGVGKEGGRGGRFDIVGGRVVEKRDVDQILIFSEGCYDDVYSVVERGHLFHIP